MKVQSALFFDIDGTIISDRTKKIPDSAKRALREAKERGHLLFINTGRTICSLSGEIRELPFDGFLCGCGIYLLYHGEVFFEKHLTDEERVRFAALAKECRIDGVFEGVEDVYFLSDPSRFGQIKAMREYMARMGLGKSGCADQAVCPYDKMYVVTDADSDTQTFFDGVSGVMQKIDRERGAYEFVPLGYSKATAIEMVLERFGLEKEQAYVFGDSGNDLPMFRYADHTVAMGDHSPMLEPYTEFVTKTVEEDGLAYAMKHYGLIS